MHIKRLIQQFRHWKKIQKTYDLAFKYVKKVSNQIGADVIMESVMYDCGNVVVTCYYERNGLIEFQLMNDEFELIAFAEVGKKDPSCMEIKRFDIVNEMRHYVRNLHLLVRSLYVISQVKGCKVLEGSVNVKYGNLFRERKFKTQKPENGLILVQKQFSKFRIGYQKFLEKINVRLYKFVVKTTDEIEEIEQAEKQILN